MLAGQGVRMEGRRVQVLPAHQQARSHAHAGRAANAVLEELEESEARIAAAEAAAAEAVLDAQVQALLRPRPRCAHGRKMLRTLHGPACVASAHLPLPCAVAGCTVWGGQSDLCMQASPVCPSMCCMLTSAGPKRP